MITSVPTPARSIATERTWHAGSHRSTVHPIDFGNRIGSGLLRRLVDSVIREGAHHERTPLNDVGLEWALVDTRECDPGTYRIRGWTDAFGVARPVESSPSPRHGGAIGLFTLQDRCVSVGPCPPTVDEGAGLLLMGFTRMMTLPLPLCGAEVLNANWVLIVNHREEDFNELEIERLLLLLSAAFAAHGLGTAGLANAEQQTR